MTLLLVISMLALVLTVTLVSVGKLEAAQRRFHRLLADEVERAGGQLTSVADSSGVVRGRPFELNLLLGNLRPRGYELTLEVPQSFRLGIERCDTGKRWLEALGGATDYKTGNPDFDERYFISAFEMSPSAGVSESMAFLAEERSRQLVDAIFARENIRSLVFADGRLRVVARRRNTGLMTGFAELLTQLCELTGLLTKARLVAPTARRELSDVKCPFCRGWILESGHGNQVLACEGCATAHHADCWEETGGCSIFGCNGRNHERITVATSAKELASDR